MFYLDLIYFVTFINIIIIIAYNIYRNLFCDATNTIAIIINIIKTKNNVLLGSELFCKPSLILILLLHIIFTVNKQAKINKTFCNVSNFLNF